MTGSGGKRRSKPTRVLSVENNSHTAAELFDNAVARYGQADQWRESYVPTKIKSMKAEDMAVIAADCWRKIAFFSLTRDHLPTTV